MKELKMEIAASLWRTPGTFEEIMTREFLKGKYERGIWTVVLILKDAGWIYEKGEILYTYQKTVKEILNPAGYELQLDFNTRSDFEKAYDKSIKRRGY